MKVVLSGVETNNKGAELMLYAILQEIERRSPGSTIIDTCYNMIDNELSKQRNAEVRCHLKKLSTSIQEESRKMWNLIWNI